MKTHYRSIFISDIHLGSRGAQADVLLDFLKNSSCDYLYLVGDIVDFWALQRKTYFPESHVKVLRKFLKFSRHNTKVIYVVGNHDEYLRKLLPLSIGDIDFCNQTVHVTADGKKLFIIHGDQFDQVVKYAKWLAWLGDIGYSILLRSNNTINKLRLRLGFEHWSLSAYAKKEVKSLVNFIGNYEQAVVKAVSAEGCDGVVCGHIHHAEIKMIDGILYANTGDFVESCTALVEDEFGNLSLIQWIETQRQNSITPEKTEMAEAVL